MVRINQAGMSGALPGFLLPRVRNGPVETTSSAESTGLRFWNGTRSCCSVCEITFDFVTPRTEARSVALLAFARTRVVESVMLFNHLLPPSPLALDLSQHQDLFQWVHSLHLVVKVLELTDSKYVSYFGRV